MDCDQFTNIASARNEQAENFAVKDESLHKSFQQYIAAISNI